MEPEKTTGYLLLALGLVMIFFSLFSAFAVYSGMNSPPRLFDLEKQESSTNIAGTLIPSIEIIPIEYLNMSGNLTFFMLFMFFVASGGGKIASIGISLIKEPKKST